MSELEDLRPRIKRVIVDSLMLDGLSPDQIADDQQLFGEGLGLDSIDGLELVLGLEQAFGIKIRTEEMGRDFFSTVDSLAELITRQVAAATGAQGAAGRG